MAKTVGFLLFSPTQELDFIGPLEVFSAANRVLDEKDRYDIQLIKAHGRSRFVTGASGIKWVVDQNLKTLKTIPHTLVIAGGPDPLRKDFNAGVRWILKNERRFKRIVTICTGSLILARTGLLDRKRASTHWAWVEKFQAAFPSVLVDPKSIWSRDGKIFSSAGVSTGIDLSLHLIEEDHGRKIASLVAKGLVVYLRRPGYQEQFSVPLNALQTGSDDVFDEVIIWLEKDVRKNVTVEDMANRCGMSIRNFSRRFTQRFDVSPKRFFRNLKIERIKMELEQSNKSWKQICQSYAISENILRKMFEKSTGVSPYQFRKHFGER